MNRIQSINALLPQTQCRECGYAGCLPYATALVNDNAPINLCAPGGQEVLNDLATVLHRETTSPQKSHQNVIAWIDEAVCIGCTACIRACPVDAIMGASKLMHTVLADECTGCGLCVAPCPVDCIFLQPTKETYLPQARFLGDSATGARFTSARHAQTRYENRIARQQRQEAERKQQHAQRAAQIAQTMQAASTQNKVQAASATALNPAQLIAQAMAKAQAQQNQRVVPSNHDSFREQQVKDAQKKATYRRYMRDAQYGNDAEKATAIAWLQQYKAEQEAMQAAQN